MTRRPRVSRTASRRVRKIKPVKTPAGEPLDAFIAEGARSLGLKIDKRWLPAVRANLQVTLRHGNLVAKFSLPDEAEPAPVFRA